MTEKNYTYNKTFFSLSILCIAIYLVKMISVFILKEYSYFFTITLATSILGAIFLYLSKNKKYYILSWVFILMLLSIYIPFMNFGS